MKAFIAERGAETQQLMRRLFKQEQAIMMPLFSDLPDPKNNTACAVALYEDDLETLGLANAWKEATQGRKHS